jgi:starch synthase (maltosyl-transferring)
MGTKRRRDDDLLSRPYATLIRDLAPTTPLGAPARSIEGDAVAFHAQLVRDGHDELSARVRFRRVDTAAARDERRWQVQPMRVEHSGDARASVVFAAAGRYEFEVQAWVDRVGTWQRDLRLRAAAGEELAVEFEVGAQLLERLAPGATRADRRRLLDAVDQLRSSSCTDRVRLTAALDDAVAAVTSTVPDPDDLTTSARCELRVEPELAVRGAWYEFFPRSEGGLAPGSGSWDRLAAAADAGFDVVYLPPIHPVGRSHRKGRDNTLVAGPDDVGSPWAIGAAEGGHLAVHPELGTLDDLRAFVARGAELGVRVALDIALQCSPDHPWVTEHPEWFSHRPDGSIRYAENPPKKYQDIFPLNFWPEREQDRLEMWQACRDVFAFWIDQGVSVFRVDNPHTKPLAFWQWCLADLLDARPDLVFLSEAFTDPPMMHSLAEIGFSQSYTYFTWRRTKWELTEYGAELAHAPSAGWFRPNLWPTTPDILAEPLRDATPQAFASRAVLAATLAPSWGVYSGYELCESDPFPDKEEYRDSEKYELKDRDHDDPASLWPLLTELNRIRRAHRSMWRMSSLRFHHVDHDDVIAYSHRTERDGVVDAVLVVVNLAPDEVREATVHVDPSALGIAPGASFPVLDELTGESWTWGLSGNYVRLDPAERVAHVFAVG